MQVVARTLVPGISITLVEDDAGWRFSAWSRQSALNGASLPPPPREVLEQRFATQDDALRHFRPLAPAHDAHDPGPAGEMLAVGEAAAIFISDSREIVRVTRQQLDTLWPIHPVWKR